MREWVERKSWKDGTLCQRSQVLKCHEQWQVHDVAMGVRWHRANTVRSIEIEIKEPESDGARWALSASGIVAGLSWDEAVGQQA